MQEFDRLLHLIVTTQQGPALYALIAVIVALDVLPSPIPSQAILITAAVLSARPDGPALWLLIVAGAGGAIAGDNAMYWVGRAFGEPAVRRLARGGRGARQVRWAAAQIERHGPALIVSGRYVWGGRTAVTLAAGAWAMPWPRFILADVCAGLSWAVWSCLLGRLGGVVFEGTWTAILVSVAAGILLALGIEGVRRLSQRS